MIEPSAVGYRGADESGSFKDNALLRERTQTGDAVIRARVVTVTSEPELRGDGWRIGLRTLETVAGKRPPDDLEREFTFVVQGAGPAAGIVRMLEARLIGSTFVVFVRKFGHDGGGDPGAAESVADIHFHFAKDDKDELGAVHQASLLGEVR